MISEFLICDEAEHTCSSCPKVAEEFKKIKLSIEKIQQALAKNNDALESVIYQVNPNDSSTTFSNMGSIKD